MLALYTLLSLTALAQAAPFFNFPLGGASVQAGTLYNATWRDNVLAPPTAQYGASRLDLCMGTATTAVCPMLIDANFVPSSMQHSFYIPPGVGPAGQYFLRIQSLKATAGGHIAAACTYPFTMNGMTGPALTQVPVQGGPCFYSTVPNKVPAAVSAAAKQTTPVTPAAAAAASGGAATNAAAVAAPAAGATANVASPAVIAAVAPGTTGGLTVASAAAAPTSSSAAEPSSRPVTLIVLALGAMLSALTS